MDDFSQSGLMLKTPHTRGETWVQIPALAVYPTPSGGNTTIEIKTDSLVYTN